MTDETYTVYKKAETAETTTNSDGEQVVLKTKEQVEAELASHIQYKNVVDFPDDNTVFCRLADDGTGYKSVEPGAAFRFTVVIWLEGWDRECMNFITHESLKMSLNFLGK